MSSRISLVLAALLCLLSAAAIARPPAITVTQPDCIDAEEMTVAINPADPSIMAVGANIWYSFRSDDGGRSWTQSNMSSTLGVWGDPVVVFDADGTLFYSHLSYPSTGSWLDRIVVQRSDDGGQTWNDGVGVGLNGSKDQDKEWMAADRTGGPYHGNLYMAWTEFDSYGSSAGSDSTRILFARSADKATTFSTPIRLSDRGGNCVDEDETVEGAVPAVGPDGQVYVAWSGHGEIVFDRSFDGGATFGQDIFVTAQPGGWDFAIPGIHRCNGMPITACDVSDSEYRGRVYVLFSDQRNGVDDTDVFLCWSDDEGMSWSAPSRVNQDTGAAQQFFPWLSVDPTTGYLHVVYYDRRDNGDEATDVYVALSTDGGQTFIEKKVSEAPFTPWAGVFFGDYIGIDAYGGYAFAVWMRMDDGHLTVRGARLVPDPTAVDDPIGSPSRTVELLRAPANPVNRQTRIAFTIYDTAPVQLEVYDLRGRLVRELWSGSREVGSYTEAWDGTDRNGTPVPTGVYLCRLQAGPDVVTRKVSIIR